MNILEDFYAQTNPDGGEKVELPFSSQTTTIKNPTNTTTTQLTPDKTESRTYASVTDTDKGSTTSTQYKENVANTPMSQPEWENQTGARAVYARLGMQPPKPSVNADRKRKIMGYQAIGEALRNVVDATYGKQKAIIVPHKSYLKEFADDIAKDDANEALKFKEYYKALDAQGKALADNYMKYYTKAQERQYDKVSTTTGNERTYNPEKITETETTKGKQFTRQTGGGSESKTTGTRTSTPPIDYSGAGKEGQHTFIFQNGKRVTVDEDKFRLLYQNAIAYGKKPTYSKPVRDLITKIQDDEYVPTKAEQAQIIQETGDKNLDLLNDVENVINYGNNNITEAVSKKRSTDYTSTPVATQSTNPVVNNKITVNGKPTYKNKKSTQNSPTDAEYKAIQDANAKKEGALKKGYKKKQAEQTTKLDFSGVKTAKIRR